MVWVPLKNQHLSWIGFWKWHFRASKSQNISGRACPQTPLLTCTSGAPSPCLPTHKFLATATQLTPTLLSENLDYVPWTFFWCADFVLGVIVSAFPFIWQLDPIAPTAMSLVSKYKNANLQSNPNKYHKTSMYSRHENREIHFFSSMIIIHPTFEWLRATIALVPFRVKFSSMSESTQTLQADLCYVKRCSCVVFSLKRRGVGERTLGLFVKSFLPAFRGKQHRNIFSHHTGRLAKFG